jgi:acyl carrier protein phosphodiesterase
MNYLAHAYLSFGRPGILVGNMISDFVKGKKKFDYLPEIQQGIALHRAIDSFTDTHGATKEAKEVFRPAYRLYAGAIVDVVYDHFLATDENEFTDESLKAFTINTYKQLDSFTDHFPEKFSMMFPYMKAQNWLYNYRYVQGTEKSLGGLVRRSQYLTESDTAYRLFIENYDALKKLYMQFFSEIKSMAQDFLIQDNT